MTARLRKVARIAGRVGVTCSLLLPNSARAQNRGVYPLGMTALNAGSLPDSGWTYANQLLYYTRDRAKNNNGNTEPVTGGHVVLMDMNTFTWVNHRSTDGVHFAASATLPFARNSLTSDVEGPINKGSGFADSYYLPLILGRNGHDADARVQYGFHGESNRRVQNEDQHHDPGRRCEIDVASLLRRTS